MHSGDSQESLSVGLGLLGMSSASGSTELEKKIQAGMLHVRLPEWLEMHAVCQEKMERIRELSKNVATELSEGRASSDRTVLPGLMQTHACIL